MSFLLTVIKLRCYIYEGNSILDFVFVQHLSFVLMFQGVGLNP